MMTNASDYFAMGLLTGLTIALLVAVNQKNKEKQDAPIGER